MSGAWWADDCATAEMADDLGIPTPDGPLLVSDSDLWDRRLSRALDAATYNYRSLSFVKGGSPADLTMADVAAVPLTTALLHRALRDLYPIDLDDLVNQMASARARRRPEFTLQHCTERSTKLVYDGAAELITWHRCAAHKDTEHVLQSLNADLRGVDAVVKLRGLPEHSVQLKRRLTHHRPSEPGIWRLSVAQEDGLVDTAEPCGVRYANAAGVDAYVEVCTASADAAVA